MHVIQQALDGDIDPKEALSKIKSLLGSHSDVNGSGDTTAADDSADTGDDSAKESETFAGVLKPLLEECRKAGVTPTPAQLLVLAEMPTESGRAAYLQEAKAAAANARAEKPKSGRVAEQQAEPAFPKTLDEFVAATRRR